MPNRGFVSALAAACLFGGAAAVPSAPPTRSPSMVGKLPTVIPFDFQSRFDGGRYGRIVGDLIWKQLDRRGGLILPESMLDVRDWSARRGNVPGPDTPMAEMERVVREDFGADIGIWGSIERVTGFEGDVYDVSICIADFSGDSPRIIYREKTRTKTVSEVPHTVIPTALDRLCGTTTPADAPAVDSRRESRWQRGPNLVQGDFERGHDAPAGWDTLPPHVLHLALDANDGSTHRIIRFELSKDLAATTGLLYYSDFFPVREGATYRFQCRWRSTGSKAKVFIKCYDRVHGGYDEAGGRRANHSYRSASNGQRREVYRSQQNLSPPSRDPVRSSERTGHGAPTARGYRPAERAGVWNVHTQDFTPRHTQFTPRWGRVMLYAYWPAGTVDWDDIVVKQIAPPPASEAAKTRRPSLETKVRSDELPQRSSR